MNADRRISERRIEDNIIENKLVLEIKSLQEQFEKTTNKLIKDVQRQEKIMEREVISVKNKSMMSYNINLKKLHSYKLHKKIY